MSIRPAGPIGFGLGKTARCVLTSAFEYKDAVLLNMDGFITYRESDVGAST